MYDGEQLKYGHIRGGEQGFNITVTATQYIAAASAKFVKRAGTNTPTATLIGLTESELLGHLETGALNSSDGTEVRKVITDLTAVFRIPVVAGTYSSAMRGKKCDVKVISNIQGACLDSDTMGHLIIEDGDVDNNKWVDVRIREGANTRLAASG